MVRELTVVVPSVNGMKDLGGCVEALERQRPDVDLEVLVVDRLGGDLPGELTRRFPLVRLVSVPPGTTIPRMRAVAFDAATKSRVAVIEDHVIVPAGWAKRLLDALEETGADAVGGSVENAATRTLRERAAFVCEYHHVLPPIPAGDVTWVAGNNVVYRGETLAARRDAWEAGRWENYLHDAIRSAGGRLVCRPEIVVGHKMHFGFWEYVSQRYLYSRSYAGARVADASGARRAAFGLVAFALPPLMFIRIVKTVWGKPGMRRELALSIPFLVPFTISWGLGEVVGYWFGAGDSLAKVR